MRVGLCLAVLAAMPSPGQTRRPVVRAFASAETCKPCHTEIYRQWRSSFHSRSAADPVFWRFFEPAVRDTDRGASALCLSCHAPAAAVGGEMSPVKALTGLGPVAKEGVTCDFCHTISGQEKPGEAISRGADPISRRAETAVKYGSHPDATTPAHRTQLSAFLKSPELCSRCHRFTHPLPGAELQNAFAEWSSGPYRAQGRSCQDCHMPVYAGKTANDGPERPHLRAHVFMGGPAEMLKKAVVMSLWTRAGEKSGAQQISVSAVVTNVGSGHLMPGGIPGIRELWLDLKVKTEVGAEVFAARATYGATLLDRDGKPATPWNAVRVGKDTRLAPHHPRRETFEFVVPNLDFKTLDVRARLLYRLVADEVARSAGIRPSPPIEVAAHRLVMSSKGSVRKVTNE